MLSHPLGYAIMYMYGLEVRFDDDDVSEIRYHEVPEDVMQFWRDIMNQRNILNNPLYGSLPPTEGDGFGETLRRW